MKVAVIVNGISRKKKKFYRHILPILQQKFTIEVFETQFAGHAVQLSTAAVDSGFDVIISAGGDGTLNQVVNGMLKSDSSTLPVLGIIPLGSGNDFATMMKVSGNAAQLVRLLDEHTPKPIDLGKISCYDKDGLPVEKYFINACSLGMGPATVNRLERLPRWLGTGLRYYASVLNTFFTHPTEEFEVRTPQRTWQGKARVVAIANGKSFGNKIYIAPDAEPDDGIFSTFIATDMSLIKFLFVLLKIKNKNKMLDKSIIYSHADELELTSTSPARIESEGELAGYLPARIQLLKRRIQFLG